MKQIHLMGIASGVGANDPGCRYAPARVKKAITTKSEVDLEWHAMLHRKPQSSKFAELKELQERIIRHMAPVVTRGSQFIVIDGDHSSAMGVWQGVMEALHPNQRFGLLWIDAHPDLHTFSTSPSGNVHGMPLAALLNQGDSELSTIYGSGPYLDPENIVMFGIRAFEREEMQLMKQLDIKYYDMESIQQPDSFMQTFQSALTQLKRQCDCFGISLDLDAIDPLEAPGVGTPEPNGLSANALCNALKDIGNDRHFVGIEIAEYNPLLDKNQLTLRCIVELISALFGDAIKPNRFLGSFNSGIRSTSRPIFNSSARR